MSASDQPILPLGGVEAGRRTHRTQWGIRYPRGALFAPPGGVDVCADEQHARDRASSSEARYRGTVGVGVVSRDVVTYTTDWADAELEHRPIVPTAGGVAPWCTCGWEPKPGGLTLAAHLASPDLPA